MISHDILQFAAFALQRWADKITNLAELCKLLLYFKKCTKTEKTGLFKEKV